MPRGVKYTSEQREDLRQKAVNLRKQGKPMTVIARELKIAMNTLNRLVGKTGRKRGRRRGATRVEASIRLSPNNPMAQLALAHERLMELNKQLEALTSERARVLEKMDALMKKAAEVCPGLKPSKK